MELYVLHALFSLNVASIQRDLVAWSNEEPIYLQDAPDWEEILRHFRGSELQNYFTKILEDNLKAMIKPQYVDSIPKAVKGKVGDLLNSKSEKGNLQEIIDVLGRSLT